MAHAVAGLFRILYLLIRISIDSCATVDITPGPFRSRASRAVCLAGRLLRYHAAAA
jgi:hypothetical protein